MSGPRVRFCPSPTGFFHVGSRAPPCSTGSSRVKRRRLHPAHRRHRRRARPRRVASKGSSQAMAWLGLTPTRVRPARAQLLPPTTSRPPKPCSRNGYLYYCDCTPAEIESAKGARFTARLRRVLSRARAGTLGHDRPALSHARARASRSCTTSSAATSSSRTT